MTFYVEWSSEALREKLPLTPPAEELARQVGEKVLELEGCPFPAQATLLLTDEEEIRDYNRRFRGVDRATDVLSFPNLSYAEPSGFAEAARSAADCFDPESGELVLGDMMLCVGRALEQAREYGHSIRREFAFLVAHSMLHLCGYDHMEPREAAVMEERQRKVLEALQITRETE